MVRERLQIYWQCEARQHLAIGAGLLVFVGLIVAGYYTNQVRGRAAAHSRTWEKVEAKVISAEIAEINTSDEYSFSTRLFVNATFSYRIDDKIIHGDYSGIWTRNDLDNWSERLRPGSDITIRVSPDDPHIVSLVDYNGIK